MDENKIRAIITQLDNEVPRENATVILEQYGGGPDESHIVANQTHYLRLEIEFLKAGFAGNSQGPYSLPFVVSNRIPLT